MQTSRSPLTEPFQHGALSLADDHGPSFARRLQLTVLIVLVWWALAWVLSGRYVQGQVDDALNQANQKIGKDISDIAIIGLGHNLNYRVIAEGVETETQMLQLQQMGCDEIQGYWFSRPLPADEFAAFVRKAQQGSA